MIKYRRIEINDPDSPRYVMFIPDDEYEVEWVPLEDDPERQTDPSLPPLKRCKSRGNYSPVPIGPVKPFEPDLARSDTHYYFDKSRRRR